MAEVVTTAEPGAVVAGPGRARRAADWLRVRQPAVTVPGAVALCARAFWAVPARREEARTHMRTLRPDLSPAELDDLARRHLRFAAFRSEVRFTSAAPVRQRVDGIEHLTRAHAEGRGVVISFLHHAHYAGGIPSVAAQGVPVKVVMSSESMREPRRPWLEHFVRMVTSNPWITLLDVADGFRAMLAHVQAGGVLALASDIPGPSTVPFLGRTWPGTTGAAGLAMRTGAPIVIVTFHRVTEFEARVQVGPVLRPEDHTDADALTAAVLTALEPSVLAWPEAYELPAQMWRPEVPGST